MLKTDLVLKVTRLEGEVLKLSEACERLASEGKSARDEVRRLREDSTLVDLERERSTHTRLLTLP